MFTNEKLKDLTPDRIQAELDRFEPLSRAYCSALRATKRLLEVYGEIMDPLEAEAAAAKPAETEEEGRGDVAK